METIPAGFFKEIHFFSIGSPVGIKQCAATTIKQTIYICLTRERQDTVSDTKVYLKRALQNPRSYRRHSEFYYTLTVQALILLPFDLVKPSDYLVFENISISQLFLRTVVDSGRDRYLLELACDITEVVHNPVPRLPPFYFRARDN